MSERWRLDNNGTGETISLYDGDRLVADIYEVEDGLRIRDALAGSYDRAALEAQVAILRRRVWALRPALQSAIKALHAVEPSYRDSHEGGEIARVIATCEAAIVETSGPSGAALAAPAERRGEGEEDCPRCAIAHDEDEDGFYDWGPGGGPPDHTCKDRK